MRSSREGGAKQQVGTIEDMFENSESSQQKMLEDLDDSDNNNMIEEDKFQSNYLEFKNSPNARSKRSMR